MIKAIATKRGTQQFLRLGVREYHALPDNDGGGRVIPTGPTSDRIREIQEALAKSGHYQGAPTGRVDAATTAALSRFQQDNGLEVSGKLTVKTVKGLEKYGLPATTYTTATAGAPEAIKQ